MADVAEKEDTKETTDGDKLVCYKLSQDLGDGMEAGKCLYLPESKGQALVEAGLAELATEEDVHGDGETDGEEVDGDGETPMVANAINKLGKRLEKKSAEAIAKLMAELKPARATTPTVPAELKTPLYKSPGAYLMGCIKAQIFGDKTEANKVMAYQNEAVNAYNKMGVQVKAPLGIQEGNNASGGFLINPQFSPDVYTIPHTQINLQDLCDPIEAKSLTYNQRFINTNSLANGSIFGGLNMVATAEGASFTSSLPAWSNVTLTLQKLAIFVYYTMEVMQDASYPLEAELNEYVNKAFIYGVNTQIIQGSTLEGAVNAPSAVTVTPSSNDTAWHTTPSTNLTYADLASIWSQVYPDSQVSDKGVWLFHPSLANPLVQMTYTFSGSSPAWGLTYNAEAGLTGRGSGVVGTPYRIFGKPAYPCWAMSAPGVAGDIGYFDFGTFKLYRRPFRVEISKEFQFGSDQVAIRFVWRGDCKTIFRNKVTGVNGTQQFSPIVIRGASGT